MGILSWLHKRSIEKERAKFKKDMEEIREYEAEIRANSTEKCEHCGRYNGPVGKTYNPLSEKHEKMCYDCSKEKELFLSRSRPPLDYFPSEYYPTFPLDGGTDPFNPNNWSPIVPRINPDPIFEYLKPKVHELERNHFYLSEIGFTEEELLPLKYTIQGYKTCMGELEEYFLEKEQKR